MTSRPNIYPVESVADALRNADTESEDLLMAALYTVFYFGFYDCDASAHQLLDMAKRAIEASERDASNAESHGRILVRVKTQAGEAIYFVPGDGSWTALEAMNRGKLVATRYKDGWHTNRDNPEHTPSDRPLSDREIVAFERAPLLE